MAESDYKSILVKKEKQTTTITLNRPDKLNALSPELVIELNSALKRIEEDSDTRAVVITGTGRAFSAGGDVQLDVMPVSKMKPLAWRQYVKKFCKVIRRIYYMQRPVIAAINGVTAGGGCDIAMACDIRIASEKARFGYGYIKMGIISDMGGSYFLPRIIGVGRAKLFAFTGDLINAYEAERIGLVDRLVRDDEFSDAVDELVQKIANGPTAAIVLIKEAMHRSSNMDLDTALDYSTNLQSAILDSSDFQEGWSAFLEKRKPTFKGKL